MSFFSRFTQEATDAFADMYGNVCLGDDAGKSARLTLVLKPNLHQYSASSSKASKLNLGMTFLEVNGRAYVQSVIPGSLAAKADTWALYKSADVVVEPCQRQRGAALPGGMPP